MQKPHSSKAVRASFTVFDFKAVIAERFAFQALPQSLTRKEEVLAMGRDGREYQSVIGLDGMPLTLADLPPTGTTRWVARRKAQVVAAVRGGLLSLEQASERYALTAEEFLSWRNAVDRFGVAGLRATHARDHMHT